MPQFTPKNMTEEEIDRLGLQDLPSDTEMKSMNVSQNFIKMTPDGARQMTDVEKLERLKDHLKHERNRLTPDPPEPDEVRAAFLERAKSVWGFAVDRMVRIRKGYSLFFDYVEMGDYEMAGDVAEQMFEDGALDFDHKQWTLDLLEGKVNLN